jgi:hypothetical protein
MNPVPYIMHTLGYIRARLGETSTWVSVGVTVAAVSALPVPWCYVGLGCGVMAAMTPNKPQP